MNEQEPLLIADIGGTNCRLAVGSVGPQGPSIGERRDYAADDFPGPAEAITRFYHDVGIAPARHAALAVAGPVAGEEVSFTNSAWIFSRSRVREKLGLDTLIVLNDLQAQSRALLDLPDHEFTTIGDALSAPVDGPVAVIAPGTGLGVACAFDHPQRFVVATEGGHVGFAPSDDVEAELLRYWRPHLGRVTNEHILSGPGLVRLYRALAALEDRHAEPLAGPEILRRALAETDRQCLDAAERFAKILGAVSGDIALAQGAREAVLSGSIASSLVPILQQGGFRARFEQRGPNHDHMRIRPTRVVARSDLGLVGSLLSLSDAMAGR